MHGLFIKHRTKPGRRDAVAAIWRSHMRPAIEANAGHVPYIYRFGGDPDVIAAFQVYASKAAAEAFPMSDAYQAYERAVSGLFERHPDVTVLEPRSIKPGQ